MVEMGDLQISQASLSLLTVPRKDVLLQQQIHLAGENETAGYRPNLEQFQDHAAHSVDDHERCISRTISMDDNYSWALSWFCWKHLSVNVA